MVFQWLLVFVVFGILIVTMYSDSLAAKKKHSSYFKTVQKPTGKKERAATIPNLSKHDQFFTKLNTL